MNLKRTALLTTAYLCLYVSAVAQNGNVAPTVATTPKIQKLSTQQIHQLALLGQVWGFLKYFHPAVAKGKYDWDEELFKKIPLVKNAKNRRELSTILLTWIDSLGDIPACSKCGTLPQNLITYNLDEKWMTDKNFSEPLQQKLSFIKNNRHQGPGHYVKYGGAQVAEFIHEKEYDLPEMIYPAEVFRLHWLFRHWNTINYFFPYKNVIGRDWTELLHEFIPRFAEAADTLQYQIAIATLMHSVNDSHSLSFNPVLNDEFAKYRLPVELTIINDEAVVTGYYDTVLGKGSGLERGDVIEKVGNQTIKELIDARAPLVGGSNYPRKLLALLYLNYICGGKETTAQLTVRTKKGRTEMTVTRYLFDVFNDRPATESVSKILPGNIGYVNMGILEVKQVDSVMHQLKACTAIIFDIRNYPRGTMFKIANYLLTSQQQFAHITSPNLDYPGTFLWKNYFNRVGPLRQDKDYFHYQGKVVLLVNENTQSHAEWTTMALQTVSGSITIGSQTSGADGNITRVVWPGKKSHVITSLGIFYPDGSPTQRVGVKIDIEVRPTVAGIREGRDEVLERAIKYIQDKR